MNRIMRWKQKSKMKNTLNLFGFMNEKDAEYGVDAWKTQLVHIIEFRIFFKVHSLL